MMTITKTNCEFIVQYGIFIQYSTFLPETLAAAAPAEAAGVGSGLSRGLGWGLDVRRLPFSHLHSTHTPGLRKSKGVKTVSD